MDPLHYKSATELASLIRRKKIGSLELLDHFLARIEKNAIRSSTPSSGWTRRRRASAPRPPTPR
jgi:Asp-tRNA(Asn)/Glu-tRNA(Gln) amidotransferase A subunit family amidase